MCSIISSSHCSLPCPNGGSGREPVFEAWLNERRVFSLLHSDCFPSVVPHWPQCRCCRRRLRWECHKWPETNVGLPHLADLQHSLKTSSFFFFLSFLFLLFQSQPVLPLSPLSHLPPSLPFTFWVFLAIYLSIHLTGAVFQPLHFPCTYICHVKWSDGAGSENIFHLSTMVNQWHQSCATCGSSRLDLTYQGKNGWQNGALVHWWRVCVCLFVCWREYFLFV